MKSFVTSAIALCIGSQAFASGSPVINCRELAKDSRLNYYISMDNDDSVDYPTSYGMTGSLQVQGDLGKDGFLTIGELSPANSKTSYGNYTFQDAKGKSVPQVLEVALVTKLGSKVIISGKGEPLSKTVSKLRGTLSFEISKKERDALYAALPKDSFMDPPMANLAKRVNTPVECEYSWE